MVDESEQSAKSCLNSLTASRRYSTTFTRFTRFEMEHLRKQQIKAVTTTPTHERIYLPIQILIPPERCQSYDTGRRKRSKGLGMTPNISRLERLEVRADSGQRRAGRK